MDYLVSTGTIIKEYLTKRKISQKKLATDTNSSEKHISNIINGKAKVTTEFALKLETVFPDVKAEFWLGIENQYQLDLLRRAEKKKKYKSLNLRELIKDYQLNYLFKGLNYTSAEKAEQFLKLVNLNSFREVLEEINTHDKLFFHDGGNPHAQFTWLKLCEHEYELQNELQNIKEFNKVGLVENLKTLKMIINSTEFDFVVNNLRRFLNDYGVALVVIEAVPTSLIRGAVKMIDNKPAIFMSTRYKSLDSFYFTLFHELHHIIEDDLSKEGYQVVLYEEDEREDKANEFAKEILIDQDKFRLLLRNKEELTEIDLITFALEQQIVVDLVVGFLERTLKYDYGINIYGKFENLRTRIK